MKSMIGLKKKEFLKSSWVSVYMCVFKAGGCMQGGAGRGGGGGTWDGGLHAFRQNSSISFLSLPNKAGRVFLWWPSHHCLNQMVDYRSTARFLNSLAQRKWVKRERTWPQTLHGTAHANDQVLGERWAWAWFEWASLWNTVLRGQMCASACSSTPSVCTAKVAAGVQTALIYPSLFFVIFGQACGAGKQGGIKIRVFISPSGLFFFSFCIFLCNSFIVRNNRQKIETPKTVCIIVSNQGF